MSTNKRRSLQVTLFLITGSFLAAHLCFWLSPNLFEAWNLKAVDRLFLLRSSSVHFEPHYDDAIVHVDLNDTSIHRLNRFYLNRSHHSQVIRNLAAMNVSLQLYDFIFAAKLAFEEDRALTDATQEAGNVYMGLAFDLSAERRPQNDQSKDPNIRAYLDRTKWNVVVKGDMESLYEGKNPLTTFHSLASTSRGLGYMNVESDIDGVFRRVPLLVRYEEAFYPSLSFRTLCDYLNVPPEKIIVRPGKTITLRDAKRPGRPGRHDIAIPIDRYGNMIINFIGPWGRMKHYDFADILLASHDRDAMEMWREELSGNIVVVSEVTTGSTHIGPVPVDSNFPLSGIHANVIHTILTESFLKELSDTTMLLVEMILLIIILTLSLRSSSLCFSLSAFGVAGSYIGIVIVSFLYGNIIFHVMRPLLMVFFAVFSIMVYRYMNEEKEKLEGLRQRDFIRATFGRYLSNEVVEELLDSPNGLKMSGEIREVTFLVSDLRGFTALSAKLTPGEVINILNRYLKQMVEIIARYRGTVDEFQGDGILVFFGAPLMGHDDPERAVACAIEMQNAMKQINKDQRRLNLPELAMGIGINSGEVVVGNIGSEKRAKYGAVGTPINTAYRIEAQTIGGQILISHRVYEKVDSLIKVRGTVDAQLKGIDHPVILYDIAGIEGQYRLTLHDMNSD